MVFLKLFSLFFGVYNNNNNNLFLPSVDTLQKSTKVIQTRKKKKKTQIMNDYTVKRPTSKEERQTNRNLNQH